MVKNIGNKLHIEKDNYLYDFRHFLDMCHFSMHMLVLTIDKTYIFCNADFPKILVFIFENKNKKIGRLTKKFM